MIMPLTIGYHMIMWVAVGCDYVVDYRLPYDYVGCCRLPYDYVVDYRLPYDYVGCCRLPYYVGDNIGATCKLNSYDSVKNIEFIHVYVCESRNSRQYRSPNPILFRELPDSVYCHSTGYNRIQWMFAPMPCATLAIQ